VLLASGTAQLTPFDATLIEALSVSLEHGLFPGLYATYLQPFLVNSDFKDLATRGALHGSAEIRDGSPVALDVELEAIDFDDDAGRMAVHGLGGRINWNADAAAAQPSRLAWHDGKAYGFTGGAASISFVTAARGLRMLEPTLLPVFDGGLQSPRSRYAMLQCRR